MLKPDWHLPHTSTQMQRKTVILRIYLFQLLQLTLKNSKFIHPYLYRYYLKCYYCSTVYTLIYYYRSSDCRHWNQIEINLTIFSSLLFNVDFKAHSLLYWHEWVNSPGPITGIFSTFLFFLMFIHSWIFFPNYFPINSFAWSYHHSSINWANQHLTVISARESGCEGPTSNQASQMNQLLQNVIILLN